MLGFLGSVSKNEQFRGSSWALFELSSRWPSSWAMAQPRRPVNTVRGRIQREFYQESRRRDRRVEGAEIFRICQQTVIDATKQ